MIGKKSLALVPKLRFPEFRDVNGWCIKSLNELLFETKHRNRTLELGPEDVLSVSGERGCVNQIEFMGRSYAGVSVKDYHVVEHGDIVYTKSPLKKNPYGIIKENKGKRGIVSTLYAVYRPFPSCSAPYLNHFFSRDYNLNSYLQPIVNKGAKNDMKVNNADVLKGDICVPELEEQQKIAACLGSLDDLIAGEARKLEALRQHKQGLMQQLFPLPGETVPRLRFREFLNAGTWEERKLDDLAKRGSGHTPNKSKADYYNGGIKWVSLADSARLDKGLIHETTIEISEEGIKNSSAVLHPTGSVILSRDAGVGKSAIINSPMAVSQHFVVWSCNPTDLSNWFLYYHFQFLKPLFERIATGNTIKTIGLPFFNALRITIPRPAEQQRIARCLASLDELLAAQSSRVNGLKAHRNGLLQQLFPSQEATAS